MANISYSIQKLKKLPKSLKYKIFGRKIFELFQGFGINVIPDHGLFENTPDRHFPASIYLQVIE